MIVVAIIGIMVASVLTRFNPTVVEHLKAAADIVSADLAYARNLAVTYNSSYRVRFSRKQNLYVIDHTGANPQLDDLPPSPLRRPSDPSDLHIQRMYELPMAGPRVEILGAQRLMPDPERVGGVTFEPLGGTKRPQTTRVWLACGSGENRRYISIDIDPVTGLASVGAIQARQPAAAIPVADDPAVSDSLAAPNPRTL